MKLDYDSNGPQAAACTKEHDRSTTVSSTVDPPKLSLFPDRAELAIRKSIRQICDSLEPRYARDCYEAGEPPTAA